MLNKANKGSIRFNEGPKGSEMFNKVQESSVRALKWIKNLHEG